MKTPQLLSRRLGKYSSLLFKFLVLSTVFCLVWTQIAVAYFSAVLKITFAYFKLFGLEVSLKDPSPDFLYSQGMRSCIPPFAALVLATPLTWRRRALAMAFGIPALFFFRVILQISYVYLQIHASELYAIFVIFLSGACRVALPFLLWIAFAHEELRSRMEIRKGKRGYICPFCGVERVGILDHIRDAHGEDALKNVEGMIVMRSTDGSIDD